MIICVQNKEKIMKKIYFDPDMEILDAETQQILAASLPTGDYEGGGVGAPEMEDDSDYDF